MAGFKVITEGLRCLLLFVGRVPSGLIRLFEKRRIRFPSVFGFGAINGTSQVREPRLAIKVAIYRQESRAGGV